MNRKVINVMMVLFVTVTLGLAGCGGGGSGEGGGAGTNPEVAKYAGTYSGNVTFLGLSDSTWNATVDTAGKIAGTFTSTSGIIQNKYPITGSVSAAGDISMKVDGASANNFTGKIAATGTASGTYMPSSGISGTFSGKRNEGAIATPTVQTAPVQTAQTTTTKYAGHWVSFNSTSDKRMYYDMTISSNGAVTADIYQYMYIASLTYLKGPKLGSFTGTFNDSNMTITLGGSTISVVETSSTELELIDGNTLSAKVRLK